MKALNTNEQQAQIKASTCSYKGCKAQAIAYCIFANKERGVHPKWKGYVCEKHFHKLHTEYVGG